MITVLHVFELGKQILLVYSLSLSGFEHELINIYFRYKSVIKTELH